MTFMKITSIYSEKNIQNPYIWIKHDTYILGTKRWVIKLKRAEKYLPLPYIKVKGLWPEKEVSGLCEVPEQYTNNWVIPTAQHTTFFCTQFYWKGMLFACKYKFQPHMRHTAFCSQNLTLQVRLGIILKTFNY